MIGTNPTVVDRFVGKWVGRRSFAKAVAVAGAGLWAGSTRNVPTLGPIDGVDIPVGVPPRLGSRLISADAQGLTAVRTRSQVLSLVYGPNAPAGTRAGLFFPNGVNGTISTV